MAKKTSKPKQLSPSDQAIYDAMPVSTQNFVNGISNPAAKSAYIRDWASSPAGKAALSGTTPTTVPATAPTTTSVGLEPFNPNIAAGTPDQTRFQPALGTEVGRFVDLMGRPVAGSAGQIPVPADPMQELRGTPRTSSGYTPLYYEDSADLINSFGYEKIAEIQNKLVKAGLLGNKYALGRVDNATRNAWIDLLEQANRIPEPGGKTSVDWNTALNIATTSPPGGTGKLPPKVSNPADILKVARQVSRNVLGREDDTILNDIVQAFQRSQVREQTGQLRMRDGMRVDAPGLEAFAERKIQQAAGPEADAYKFAQFAENLFGMAGSGEGVQRDVELEAVGG
jgi:hypothetical protein